MMYTRECSHIDRVYVIAWVSNIHTTQMYVPDMFVGWIDFLVHLISSANSIRISYILFKGHPKETLQQITPNQYRLRMNFTVFISHQQSCM